MNEAELDRVAEKFAKQVAYWEGRGFITSKVFIRAAIDEALAIGKRESCQPVSVSDPPPIDDLALQTLLRLSTLKLRLAVPNEEALGVIREAIGQGIEYLLKRPATEAMIKRAHLCDPLGVDVDIATDIYPPIWSAMAAALLEEIKQ